MSDKKSGFWSWALTPRAGGHMLVFISILCAVLLVTGFVLPMPDTPFIADIPAGAALAAFFAALVAVVLSWPLRFLLRRRAGYYASGDDA